MSLHRNVLLRCIGGLGALALGLLLAGCAEEEPQGEAYLRDVRAIASPAGAGSGQPYLHTGADGQLYLSWLAPADTAQTVLRYAVRREGGWTPPSSIARGADWFVNWADFPSLVAFEDGALAAHFLVESGPAPYAYDVHIVRSGTAGAVWSGPVVPHRDGTPTEHGFVTMLPGPEGRLDVVWLDGRDFAEGGGEGHGILEHEMTLRYAAVGPEGELLDEALLDGRVCDCCQTAAARTPEGLVVAYRDRSPGEVRDIAVVRRRDGVWTEPKTLHADGWEIAACPVNGPALAAEGARVAVAWFTAARDTPRVKVAFSDDGGGAFGAPLVVDAGDPLGRVDVVLLSNGAALVSWMEREEDEAALRVRAVAGDGLRGASRVVARFSAARASGFPQMEKHGRNVYFAWTEPGEPSQVRTAAAALPLP